MNKPDKIFDGLLVLQCQNGDKNAMTLLVNRWHKKLIKQTYFYTQDLDLAQDIVQDSWQSILKKIYSLNEPNSFGSWASTIVNRKAIDFLRKNKKRIVKLHHYNDHDRITVDTFEKEELINLIHTAIKKLPKNQQIILTLFYVDEFSINEISNVLNLPIGTVKSRLFYAREKLKIILKSRNHEK